MERWLFAGLTLFWVLEYIRPPALASLHMQMPLSILLPFLAFRQFGSNQWSRLLTAQVLFLGLNAIHVPIASNNFSAYLVTKILFGHIAIALTMALLLSDPSRLRLAVGTWVAVMSYAAIFGLLHAGMGPGAMLGDENELALGCVTTLPLAFFSFRYRRGRARLFFVAATGLLVAAVVASMSRGGFVALVVVATACVLLSPNRLRTIALIVAGGLLVLTLAPSEYFDEIRSIGGEVSGEIEHGTGETRQFLWATAVNMFKSNPLLGIGGGNFAFQVGEFQPDWDHAMYRERDWSGQAVHSLYFELLSEQGLLGIGAWGFMLFGHLQGLRSVRRLILRDLRLPEGFRREIDFLTIGFMVSTAGYLVAGAFLSVAYYPYLWYLVGFSIALTTSARSTRRRLLRRGEAARSQRTPLAIAEAKSPA